MKKQIIKGDIYIIPGIESLRFKEFPPMGKEYLKEELTRLTGITPKDEDVMVPTFVTNRNGDKDWSTEFGSFQRQISGLEDKWLEENWNESDEDYALGYFPGRFPKRLFVDIKEGEVVNLQCPEYGVDIQLTLKSYNYNKFGSFEDLSYANLLQREKNKGKG